MKRICSFALVMLLCLSLFGCKATPDATLPGTWEYKIANPGINGDRYWYCAYLNFFEDGKLIVGYTNTGNQEVYRYEKDDTSITFFDDTNNTSISYQYQIQEDQLFLTGVDDSFSFTKVHEEPLGNLNDPFPTTPTE